MTDDHLSKIVGEWTRSRFDIILSIDDLELVEEFARWAVDWRRLSVGPELPNSVEEAA